jgi:hypothetical protein
VELRARIQEANGDNPNTNNNLLSIYDLDTKEMSEFGGGENSSSLPSLYYYLATVSDGEMGYIIEEFGEVPETDGSFHPTDGIIRLIGYNACYFI